VEQTIPGLPESHGIYRTRHLAVSGCCISRLGYVLRVQRSSNVGDRPAIIHMTRQHGHASSVTRAEAVTLRGVVFEEATIHLPALRHSPPHYDCLSAASLLLCSQCRAQAELLLPGSELRRGQQTQRALLIAQACWNQWLTGHLLRLFASRRATAKDGDSYHRLQSPNIGS
jgi:hypothetical protein